MGKSAISQRNYLEVGKLKIKAFVLIGVWKWTSRWEKREYIIKYKA